MTRMANPGRLVVLALLAVLALAISYRMLTGPGSRGAPEASPEKAVSCSSCDAHHARLRDRSETLNKLMEGSE